MTKVVPLPIVLSAFGAGAGAGALIVAGTGVEGTGSGIAWKVRELLHNPLLRRRAEVVLDLTGVGRPTADIFVDQGIFATCVTITAGHETIETERRYWSVPKLTLISSVLNLLHDDRLHIAAELADAPALFAEFQAFHGNHTDTGRWTFGARSGQHDDLVLALALCCWRGSSRRDHVIYRLLGNTPPASVPDDDLAPGPGEVVVRVRERVWHYGSNKWLEPGRRIMSEDDAARYAQYLA